MLIIFNSGESTAALHWDAMEMGVIGTLGDASRDSSLDAGVDAWGDDTVDLTIGNGKGVLGFFAVLVTWILARFYGSARVGERRDSCLQ